MCAGDKIYFQPLISAFHAPNTLQFGHPRKNIFLADNEINWLPKEKKGLVKEVRNCAACLSSGGNIELQIPSKEKNKSSTESGEETHLETSGKQHNLSV